MYGFYRIAAAVPVLKVADPAFNSAEIVRCAKMADAEGAAAVLFPELSITGYSCGDLFHQALLLEAALEGLFGIAEAMKESDMLVTVGLPVRFRSKLYNCAALLQRGLRHGADNLFKSGLSGQIKPVGGDLNTRKHDFGVALIVKLFRLRDG